MSATQKFFKRLFGQDGDRAALADDTAGDGSVTYQQGYGTDYQRGLADPLKKNVERTKLNQALYDITLGLRQYQTSGFPEFIVAADNGGAAFPYARNSYVRWTDGNVYFSLVDGNTSTPADLTKWAAFGAGVGQISYFPATTAPAGYVKANGVLLTRAAYPLLWAFAQASGNLAASDGAWLKGQFSPGDGSTNFRVPDLRGRHLRAWDDSAGIDAGRGLGTVQTSQNLSHNHAVSDPAHVHGGYVNDPGHGHSAIVTDPQHAHGVNDPQHAHGIQHASNSSTSGGGLSGADHSDTLSLTDGAYTGISIQAAPTGISVANYPSTTGVTAGTYAQYTGVSIVVNGGTEVRVENIAELACIRYL